MLRGNDQEPAREKERRIRGQRSATVGERKWRRSDGRTKNYQEEESATGARLRSRADMIV